MQSHVTYHKTEGEALNRCRLRNRSNRDNRRTFVVVDGPENNYVTMTIRDAQHLDIQWIRWA